MYCNTYFHLLLKISKEFAGTPLPVKALKSATANNGLLIDYREKQIQTLRESVLGMIFSMFRIQIQISNQITLENHLNRFMLLL